jgi:hypothetical protein
MAAIQRLRQYKWIIVIAAIGAFLFYWYEVRPITLYRSCAAQSSADARKLLASKAEIAKGTDKGTSYDQLIEKNMYLRSDYESFLSKCLLHYGLEKPTVVEDPNAADAAAPKE